jgi:WD40 repeat protein
VIREFLDDAEHFVRTFGHIVNQAPLQLYSSGLVFAPEKSAIRESFELQISPFIRRISKTAVWWNPEQIMKGNDGPEKVAFSPNGQLLAVCCSDWKILLWEVPTGKLQHIIRIERRLNIPKAWHSHRTGNQ